ncbi:MAG: PPC domain-containing DNA-binding protein [Candidatus Cryptobacteroides sp.]|jgi:predicted DNA-binding protein with PD1-like motif
MYKFKQSGDTYVVSINNHQEVATALTAFCAEQSIRAGEIHGLGAVCEATLRFLDPVTKQYVDKTFREQMEVSNLVGNISEKERKVYLHLHATLCRADYSVVGGHLLSAVLNGAFELVVRKIDLELGRRFDAETGLNLYDFQDDPD